MANEKTYIPTTWETGDIITAQALNNIEQGLVNLNVQDIRNGGSLDNYKTTGIYLAQGNLKSPISSSDNYFLYVYEDDDKKSIRQMAIGEMGLATRKYYYGSTSESWSDWTLYTVEQKELDACLNLGQKGVELDSTMYDLNNCTTPGQYVILKELVRRFVNCPVFDESQSYILIVMAVTSVNHVIQIIIPSTGDQLYMRSIASTTISQWREFSSTPVATIITQQPQDVDNRATPDNPVTFSVAATGDNLTYQWQYRSPSISSWVNVSSSNSWTSGYNTNTLTVQSSGRNQYKFHCIITTSDGTRITSRDATLRA